MIIKYMSVEESTIPGEFKKVIYEFINDIMNTFPEYKLLIQKWWKDDDESMKYIYNYCMKVYPERLFEILYQNVELFTKEYNTEFLPGISFKYLWACDITDRTRETIWKYLQLIVISLIGSIKDKNIFGETSKLLENINEDEFKQKLEETLDNMKSLFQEKKTDDTTIPSPDDIQDHLFTMMNGNLGSIAKEIAEETVNDFNIDIHDESINPQDMFKKLFSEPDKLMNLVKNVGSKLDSKMKNGDINQGELFKEATQMLNQMKSVPGMENIQDMISKFGGGQKINKNAMKSELEKRIKSNNIREKLRKKHQENKLSKELNEVADEFMNDDEIISMFSEDKKKNKKKKEKKLEKQEQN
jgi:hypothetical protein